MMNDRSVMAEAAKPTVVAAADQVEIRRTFNKLSWPGSGMFLPLPRMH